MAEKKSWRDYSKSYSDDETSEETTSSKKTGTWRDYTSDKTTESGKTSSSWRNYSTFDVGNAVGSKVTDQVNNWLNSYNSYISDYQKRYSGRKGNIEDAYVSDSADWLNTVTQRKRDLTAEYDAIISYLDQNKDYLDSEWVDKVKYSLTKANIEADRVIKGAKQDNDYWNSFGSDAELLEKYGSAQGVYEYYQRSDGYNNKYEGLSSDDLKWASEFLEDGEEKEWLNSYQSSVYHDEMLKYDTATAEQKLKTMEQALSSYGAAARYYDMYQANPEAYSGSEYDFIRHWVDVYEGYKQKFGSQEELEDKIQKTKQDINYAKNAQETQRESEKWNSYTKDANFNAYAQKGAAIENPTYGDAQGWLKVGNWRAGADDIQNIVTFSRENYNQIMNDVADKVTPVGDPLYIQMTQDEVDLHNAILASEGKETADAYLAFLKPQLQAREGKKTADMITGIDIPVLEDLAVLGYGFGAGVDQWISGTKQFFTGEELDPSSTQYANQYIAESLDGKFGQYAHQAATSVGNMAPSILVSSVLGYAGAASAVAQGAGAATMGLSVAGNAYSDALAKGYDKASARTYGTLVGASEGLLQYLIGGISSLGGMSGKLATKVAAIDSGLLRAAAKLGLNIGSEILEEEIQNYLEPAFRSIIFGEYYDAPTIEELVETAIITALSTGVLEGGSTISETRVEQNLKKQYDGNTGGIIKEGLDNGVDLAKQYKAKTDSGKNLTGAEIRQLLSANQEAVTPKDMEKIQKAAEAKLTELGQTENVSELARIATKWATGQQLTRAEKKLITNSEHGSQVADQMLPKNIKAGDWAAEIGTRYVNAEAYNKTLIEKVKTAWDEIVKGNDPSTYKSLEERVGEEDNFSVSESGKATIRKSGVEIDLTKPKVVDFVKDSESGRVTDMVLDVNGEQVKASEIDYADDSQSYLYSAVYKIENITPEDATVIIRDYDPASGLTVSEYLNGMDEAFTYGYHGYSEADLKAGKFAPKLNDTMANSAYILGQNAKKNSNTSKTDDIKKMRTAVEAETQKAMDEGKEAPKAKPMTITYNDNGTIVDYSDVEKKLKHRLKDDQKSAPALAKVFHKMGLGTDFQLFESYVRDGVRFYIDENGVEQRAPSGVYRMSDGKILIDLNAYNGRGLTLDVMAHELTHFIQQWSDTKYQVLADFLIKTYEKTDMSMHERVIHEQNRINKIRKAAAKANNTQFKPMSYNEAFDEVVANAMSKMLADGNVATHLTELKAQDERLAKKLWQKLKKLLNEFLNLVRSNDVLFSAAGDLQKLESEFKQLQQMWADAFVEASENFQASRTAIETEAINSLGENAKVETNEAGELLLASNESGNVQVYSEHTYLNGGREKLEMALRQNGHTDAEIQETLSYVDDALDYIKILAAGAAKNMGYTALSNHLIADIVTNVKTGKQVMSSIVNNGDYPVNIDLSLICKKRVAYMNLMSRLIRDGVFDKVNYDGAAIAEVNEILRENGFETACLGCFVESRRLQFQTWAETIVSEWNAEVEKRNPNAENFGFAKGKMENLTDADIDALTRELESVKKNDQGNVNLGQGNSVTKMGRLLDALPSLQKKLTVEDLLTPEGLTALRKHDGSLFSIVKSRYGAASPKIVQDFNPYASEIAMLTFAQVKGITNNAVKGAQAYVTEVKNEYGTLTKTKGESKENFKKRKDAHEQRIQDEAMRRYLYDIGGARIQSFSDFMIENIFDYIQIFADLSAKRLPLHGYTKEIVCMRLFGMTGAKWNGSLIAHVERSMGKELAGLLPAGTKDGIPVKVNGKDYVIGFDDYARNAATNGKSFIQSIGMKDVIALMLDPRYSPYVGNITIGVSDAQILAMLDSPLFRMVIPYHASGMLPMFAKLVGVDLYNDYTDYQNTTVRQYYDVNGNAVSELKNAKGETVKADTSYAFNAEIQKTKDAKIAANNYLNWCAQRHPVYDGSTLVGYATFNPKFSSSPYGTDFTRHENYYKLLEDFNTYDCITEESSVQGSVTMNFPSEQNRLTAQQMEEYKNALRETGIFTEKDIEKYAKKADMTFKEIIEAEVGNRADYAKAQAPKWESTVKAVEEKLQKDYAREQQSSHETDLDGVPKRVSNKELSEMDDTALYIKNTAKANYIGMIFNGAKTEETRSRRTLDAFIGKDFYVTDGKYVYGSIVLGEPHQYTEAEFHKKKNQLKHRVPVGDKYDIKPGGTKWAYPIESYNKFDEPKKLSESTEYKNSFQARQVMYSSQETDIDTDQEVTYHKGKNREVIGNERREESREDFDRRTSAEVLTKGQKGRLAYAYRSYVGTAISERAKTAEKELKKMGIPVYIYEKLESNSKGITTSHENAGAAALPGVGVFIPFNADVDSMEIVGHEGFHFFATLEDRANYISVLVDNIDFASAEFISYQTRYVQEKYFEEEVETDGDEFDLLSEEIFAYITGDIHSGDPKGEVHKFLRDYDAVKATWDDFIKKHSAGSLYSSHETDIDSDGKKLSREQVEFFKDSVVRDKNGKLLVVRHGTSEDFHIFDFAKSGKNGKAEGYGFYFSDEVEITKRYGEIQKEVYLNITKPLYNNKRTIKKAELVKLANALIDFNLEKYKTDGLVWQDSFISNYVNTYEYSMSRRYAVQEFVNQIWDYNTNDQDLVFEIAQADGRMYESSTMKEFYDVLTKTIGYDGIIAEWSHPDGNSNVYVTFDSEQSKYTSNKNPTSNPDMRYSEHETDYSNRSLLANAFEGITKDSIEYTMIQDYKGHINVLNMLDKRLSVLNGEIRDIRFTEGKYDAKKLQELENERKDVIKEINRYDKMLLNLEASEPLRKVIVRERQKEAQKTKAHVKEIQQNKKVRAEQTELRHKIRKTVRDLNKILNRGNKKQNVKEDMKGFVSKALDLADYLFTDHISNDELIRRGIDADLMRGNEAQLVKETEEILSKLYDHADSLTDEEFTRLDAKRKANEAKLKDLLTAQRNKVQETPVYNLFNDLVTEYASLKNSSQDAVKAAYSKDVENLLKSFLGDEDSERTKALQNMRVADMTTEELWKLYNAYTVVLTTVRDANKFFAKGMTETIEQVAGQIASDFSSRKIPEKKLAIVAQKLSNKIGWDYEKLYYALDRIGSDSFTKLIMNLADSENTVMQDIIEAVNFRDEIVEKYGFNNWAVNKKIDREFLDNTGKKFKLTLGELMSLYAYSRREGAWDHIEYGGFAFGKNELTNPKPADTYKLSKEQCEAITSLLTKEQKGYVEEMQKYLSETMGAKGNEVSMKLYGIKMFGEKNYFPLHIYGVFKAQAQESQAKAAEGFTSMSNAGFTHAQNPNAKAPFVLEGFNEVWSDHVNEMSRYHGTVPALEDIRRVMNRSTYSDSVAESQSIKQQMINAYGEEAMHYFDSLYREANSGAIRDKLEQKSKKLLSMFRKNSVAYKMSVLIQQPASLVRAYAMIDRKYFGFKGLGAITSGVARAVGNKWTNAYTNAYNEMLKYAPGVTMAKEIGGFDTATGGSIRSTLLDTGKSFGQKFKTDKHGKIVGFGKAVLDKVDNNVVANLPNVADKIAWIEIWNACKRETVAKHKDLATNSDEFMQIVGERFTEVIRATQVYDSIFAKSPMLKSKHLAVQYLVSFMNEPNTVANMLEKAVRDVTKGNKEDALNGLKTAHVVIHSIIFTNLLKSIVYAMSDDDEDETYIEKYIEAVVGNVMSDFNPLSYIPFGRDVLSLMQGYDVERPDMAIIGDAIDAVRKKINLSNADVENMTEEQLIELDKKVTEANWKLAESVAAFFGIPIKNVRRDVMGVVDTIRIASANAGMTTALSVWDTISEAVIESIPFMSTKETKVDKLYDAIVSGDQAYVDRIKATYKTESAYQSAVRKALRENDPRIRQAAQARYEGNTEEYKRIFREIQKEGKFSFDDIMSAINSEESAIKNKNEPDKATSDYGAGDFVDAVIVGNTSSAKAIRDDIIATHIANGKTQKEAEEAFASSVKTSINDAYSSGLLDDTGAKNMLIEYADMDEEDATSRVSYWAFCDENPKYAKDVSEAKYNKYKEFAEPAGIDLDAFVQYIKGTKGLETIKDEWGDEIKSVREQVLEVIDSLPLTWQQKDALYLAHGYAESKIWDVPW